MSDWVVFLTVLLGVIGAPFVAVMAVFKRISDSPRPVMRSALLAWAWFVVITTTLAIVGRSLQLGNGMRTLLPLIGVGSLAAGWAVWRLTRRYSLAAVPVGLAVGSVPLFFYLERLTHGPFYIRSEGVAILSAIGTAALAWHLALATVLLTWAKIRGRPESRRNRGRCPRCGYDLHGLVSPTCPECGSSVPPHGSP